MFKFNVSYYEESRPNGKRSFTGFAKSYEDVLFTQVIDTIHLQATDGYNYEWPFLNHSVFIQQTNVNTMICEYDVQIHHIHRWNEVLGNYKVEIECLTKTNEQSEIEALVEQNSQIGKRFKTSKPKKSTQLTSWLQSENRGVKVFIVHLYHTGSLKELKTKMSKATYYRNLNICEKKGYIKKGKLVKRILVSKLDKD